jgi:hypothetical protein
VSTEFREEVFFMQCELCKANAASAAWQPFGPATGADSFAAVGQHDPEYPAILVCAPCQQRFQQRQEAFCFTYRHFAYRACEGRVELLPNQQMAGRPVKKAELSGDRIIDVSTELALTQDGALAIVEVVVTLASQRRIRYRSDGEGSNLVLPNKYCSWGRQTAGDSG